MVPPKTVAVPSQKVPVVAEYDVSRNVEALEALFRETVARRLEKRRVEKPPRETPERRPY